MHRVDLVRTVDTLAQVCNMRASIGCLSVAPWVVHMTREGDNHSPQTESVRSAIDGLLYRILQPVEISGEQSVICERPVQRIVQQLNTWVQVVFQDLIDYELRERPGPCLCI